MAKRKRVDMETGKEKEEASPKVVLVPEPVVKRVTADPIGQVPTRPKVKPRRPVVPKQEPELEPQKPIVIETLGDFVMLICLRPSRRNEVGRVTKTEYVFEGGKPVSVDVRDAEYLKAARRGSRSGQVGDGETRIFVEPDNI